MNDVVITQDKAVVELIAKAMKESTQTQIDAVHASEAAARERNDAKWQTQIAYWERSAAAAERLAGAMERIAKELETK